MTRLVLSLLTLGYVTTACTATPSGGPTTQLCIDRGLCTAATSVPAGVNPDSCYDGCNWCTCNSAGELASCTARSCTGDAEFPDAGH